MFLGHSLSAHEQLASSAVVDLTSFMPKSGFGPFPKESVGGIQMIVTLLLTAVKGIP